MAAKSRCENPNDPAFLLYGARGIKFMFPSVLAAGLWAMENLKTERNLELDRIDNNGHYAAGNLRFVPREINQANRRCTRHVEIHGARVPMTHAVHVFRHLHPEVRYSDHTITRLLTETGSVEKVVSRWRLPSCKPKGRYGTFLTPDPEIVSRYLDASFTTASIKPELEASAGFPEPRA
jgi:hypothetical protein